MIKIIFKSIFIFICLYSTTATDKDTLTNKKIFSEYVNVFYKYKHFSSEKVSLLLPFINECTFENELKPRVGSINYTDRFPMQIEIYIYSGEMEYYVSDSLTCSRWSANADYGAYIVAAFYNNEMYVLTNYYKSFSKTIVLEKLSKLILKEFNTKYYINFAKLYFITMRNRFGRDALDFESDIKYTISNNNSMEITITEAESYLFNGKKEQLILILNPNGIEKEIWREVD